MEIIKAVSSVLNCPSRPVYVAYSGGVDSHVLLHCVTELMDQYPQHQYVAIHINHGLSANAQQWQSHCQQVCQQRDIAFVSRTFCLENTPRTSLEAQAREARYAAIDDATPDNAMILLAQHQDDQLETFLLQLKRGAGPKGLSSMAALQSGKAQRQFMRPLLAISREQILAYARQQGLHWQEDESNQDVRFDRNFLRQQVIPLLTRRWPAMASSVSRSAALCAEQQSMLDEISQQYLDNLLVGDNCLAIDPLLALSPGWQKQVIRLWLSLRQIPLPNAKIMALIEPELLLAPNDSDACIQWQNWQLRKFEQRLYVLSEPVIPAAESKIWRGEKQLTLAEQQIRVQFDYQDNQGLRLGFDNRKATIKLGFGSFAETFKPAGERHSKPLKKWFQLWQVPPWKRASIPLVYVNGELAMVVGLSVAEQFSTGQNQIWIKLLSD